MNKSMKIAVVAVLAVGVAFVLVAKHRNSSTVEAGGSDDASAGPVQGLPRLVELGSHTCIPCKAMMPILAELKTEYAGALSVEFYDVKEEPAIATEYKISLIPTQIFFDASGEERFRHEGFFAKEDILAKFKEFGVELSKTAAATATFERFTPAKSDDRPKDSICYMCDRDITPKTLVTVETDKGPVKLCSPPLLLHHVLVSDRGQDRLREESHAHRLGRRQCGPGHRSDPSLRAG